MDRFHDTDYYLAGIAVNGGAAAGRHAARSWTQIAERGSFSGESSGLEHDHDRFQFDVPWKF